MEGENVISNSVEKTRLWIYIIVGILLLFIVGLFLFFMTKDGKLNISECKQFENTGYKTDCYISAAERRQDVSICNKMDGLAKDFCYSKVGIASADISICERIKDKGTKEINQQSAYEDCYYGVAVAKNDSILCAKIINLDRKSRCYTQIAKAKKDISICSNIVGSDFYLNQCTYLVAVLKNDPALCEKTSNQGNCYSFIAKQTKDPTLCEKFTDDSGRFMCYRELFMESEVSICEKVKNIYYKDDCYSQFGMAQKDKSFCDLIINQTLKDTCNYIVAQP